MTEIIESQQKVKRLKIIILILILIVVIPLLFLGGMAISSTSTFCALCHEMKPEAMTWKASIHSQISCADCHVESGVLNIGAYKLGSPTHFSTHITSNYQIPIKIKGKISNDVCLGCHTYARTFTPPIDVKMPHREHIEVFKLNCVDCHYKVAHGGIYERKLTDDGVFESWSPDMAKVQVQPQFTEVVMEDCIACHKTRKGPTNCSACHSEIVEPQSHQTNKWDNEHGKEALANGTNECNKCHSITNTGKKSKVSNNTVVQYVRNNSFCNDCHSKKKRPIHDGNWEKEHKNFVQFDFTSCFVCHDGAKGNSSNKVYCKQCHEQNF